MNATDAKFRNIIRYQEYAELNESDAEEQVSKTLALCENSIHELERFCEENVFNETDKVNFVYYCLSQDPIKWDRFLTNEFLRVYKLAVLENNLDKFFPLLDTIIVDEINSIEAEKVRRELSNQFNSSNLATRLATMQLIYNWVERDVLMRNLDLLSRIELKMNDANWKVRWHAYDLLKENQVEVKELGILDKIKGKLFNLV